MSLFSYVSLKVVVFFFLVSYIFKSSRRHRFQTALTVFSLSISFSSSIFVAFILEAFLLEYPFRPGKIERVFSEKIKKKGIGVGKWVSQT